MDSIMSGLPNDIISRIIREAPGAKDVHRVKMDSVFEELVVVTLHFWWRWYSPPTRFGVSTAQAGATYAVLEWFRRSGLEILNDEWSTSGVEGGLAQALLLPWPGGH